MLSSALPRSLSRRYSSALAGATRVIESSLDEIRAAGTWKSERVIVGPQAARIRVDGQRDTLLNFCANNYLGLSNHPEVIAAGQEALRTHGAGLGSVRFICGTTDLHKELEEKISRFHGREDTILYASCFDANAGVFEVLLGPDDALLSDELNHASIIDGIRLCKARRLRYRHNDLDDLQRLLQSPEATSARLRLIVSDGVFSMDGDLAKLEALCDVADAHDALVFLDECHATGVVGATGRGTEEAAGQQGRVDIINSTLGKALGGAAGGYTTGPRAVVDLLRNRSRPYLFSNTLPPPVVATASKVLDLLMQPGNDFPERLRRNTTKFRGSMRDAGFQLSGDENHPICPVMLGDARLAIDFADRMLNEGVYVIGFSYPVVPKGKARIRVQLSAAHTDEDIQHAVDAFVKAGRELGVVA